MTVSPHITLILDDTPTLRPRAQAGSPSTGPIGSVGLGDLGSGISIQSCSVPALLALADAAQEAARLLRREQLATVTALPVSA